MVLVLVSEYTGTVNTNSAGSYTVFYNATDNAGNIADGKVTRTVNVIPR